MMKFEAEKSRSYRDNIVAIMDRQKEKGMKKYGETLEDNTTLSREQRIEHLQEELIDGLQYCEHIKAALTDELSVNDYARMAMRTCDMFSESAPLVAFISEMDYDCDAKKTVSKNIHFFKALNGAMGLNGEAGEVIDILKKHIFQGHNFDKDHFIEEVGDCAWYIAQIADALGVSLQEIFLRNIEKLKSRYPDGFDKARSINRES